MRCQIIQCAIPPRRTRGQWPPPWRRHWVASRPCRCTPASVVVLEGQGDAGRGHWRGTPACFDCFRSFLMNRSACLDGVSSHLGSAAASVRRESGVGLDSKGRGDDGTPLGRTGNRWVTGGVCCNLHVRQKQANVWDLCAAAAAGAAAVARLVTGFYFLNQDRSADEIWSHFIFSSLWREPLHGSE